MSIAAASTKSIASGTKNDSKRNTASRVSFKEKSKSNEDEFMAAAIGDEEWLRQSVRHAKEISFDKNGLAALHLSSLHGRLACVKLLVEKFKHDVNLSSSTGWRPIHLAISNQTGKMSFAVLQYLLKKGADVTVANDDGITPMHQAASEGHIQCLKALIDHGAKIYVKDYRGHTPLDLAKLWGHRQCARVLATEQWHQEKDEVAKELAKLKKKKMVEELEGLSILEEQAGKLDYGADAYKDWLNDKGMHVDKEGRIKSGKQKTLSNLSQHSDKQGLYKANSISNSVPMKSTLSSLNDKLPSNATVKERTMDSLPLSSTYYNIYEKPPQTADKAIMDKEKRAVIMAKKHIVEEKWNFSPQCTLLGHYQQDLADCYPRDPVTKLPHRNAAPKYLSMHKNVPISAFSKPDAYKSERRVVFQPETILDVPTKVKYSDEQLQTKPQVFLNISNDLNSQMFQGGLYVDMFPDLPSISSQKESLTSLQ